jgi:hypothetical protein
MRTLVVESLGRGEGAKGIFNYCIMADIQVGNCFCKFLYAPIRQILDDFPYGFRRSNRDKFL